MEDASAKAIGSRRFWAVAAAVFLLLVALLAVQRIRVARADAIVPVLTLTGPDEIAAGETIHYAVLARDRFGAPIPGADVRLGFERNGLLELGRGRTGEGGEATIEVRVPDDFAEERLLHATTNVGVTEGSDYLIVNRRQPPRGSIFVSTDKPLYQPGQTIHARALAMAGDKPVAERSAVIEVRTEDNVKVLHVEKPTSAFGVVAFDFALADQVKLGRYRIDIAIKNDDAARYGPRMYGSREVEVKRYTLPKLKAVLEDVSPLSPNEPLTGVVRATWMFGEPVTRGRVQVWLSDRHVDGALDENGTYRFVLPPPIKKPSEQPHGEFTLSARVSVEGGLVTLATTRLTMREMQIKLETFAETAGPLVRGVPQTVYAVLTGEPTPGVTIRVLPDGPQVKTGPHGIAKLTVTPPLGKPGDFSTSVPIAAYRDDGGEGAAYIDATDAASGLVVRPERDLLSGGEAARVAVFGAHDGDRIALRATKGAEPIALGTCIVVDGTCEARLALPREASGLVWLHAMSLPADHGPIREGSRLVMVGAGGRDLSIKATPTRASFSPRETGNVDVAVTGVGGAPVKAQLGVAVADEAVFALMDVRPDLEKIFFTIDKDLAEAQWLPGSVSGRGPRSSSEAKLPVGTEPRDIYDASTAEDVRGALLSAIAAATKSRAINRTSAAEHLRSGVAGAVDDAKVRLKGWLIVLFIAAAIAAFASFATYGVAVFRRPAPLEGPAADVDTFRREIRALAFDWFVALVGPPLLALVGGALDELFFDRRSVEPREVGGTWLLLAVFCIVLLVVRAVRRVQRTALVHAVAPLRRALAFLPVGLFFGHLAAAMVLGRGAYALESLFGFRKDAYFVLLLLCASAQLTAGLLAVVRQALLRPVTSKGRVWLLLSRATLVGLPVTLGFAVFLVVAHVRDARTTWAERAEEERATEVVSNNADNKEGGTGTRAKGEEGSMGNPSTSKRYAVAGPKDNDTRTPILRDYFPETLLWAPEVITDDAGHAKIDVTFADSITTWRFGINAVSRAGQLGSATIPLVVKQDFFVDASLAPTLTQGDEIAMPVTVFSYTEGEQDVSLEIEGEGLAFTPARAALHLAPREARGLRIMVRAEKAGERAVRLKAIGATRSDALERKVTIVPNGLAVTRARSMLVTGETSSTVALPQGAIDGGNDLYVKVYGGPLSQVAEGLDGVFLMPHGCFEQTSSTTYPSILALDYLKRSKTVSPEIERRARRYIAEGFQRLVSFEVSGGGFSLFGSAPARIALTAYGLMEFADMGRIGDVDEDLLRRTRRWLYDKHRSGGWADDRGSSNDPDSVITAYVAWAVANVYLKDDKDDALPGVLDEVERASGAKGDDAYALALRANALVSGKRLEAARRLAERLTSLAIRDDEGVHWTSKSTGVMGSTGPSMDIEVTGLAAHALASVDLASELRKGALSWLAARRGPYGTWSTTPATIAAMRALLDEARPVERGPQDITVLADGSTVESFRLEPNARDVHRLVGLRKFALSGKHEITVRATGSADVAAQVVSTHYVPWQRQAGKELLALDVDYPTPSVTAGQSTTARIRLAWAGAEPARMPLVEIAIPPAFEVDTDWLDRLVAEKGSAVLRTTVERGKVTLYLLELPKDKPLVLDMPLRARWPAKVTVPSSLAYLYYEPEIRSETRPAALRAL